nr:ribonuclease H-like domain-containing protein [Tanacetum cinerariifolium]
MTIRTHDHNNEPLSSTLVPNVPPSVDTNALLLQELDLLFSPLCEEYFVRNNCGVIPIGRIDSPGSNNDSDDASIHNEAINTQQQPNIQPQIITTVLNNNAKLLYLKKGDSNGNSLKRTRRDRDRGVIILPPKTAEEHIAVQRESKARTTLLQSIPNDRVADFHYMDDARDIWNAVKARFGGNAKSKKIRKSMLKQEFLEFRIGEAEGLHKGSQDVGDAGEFALMGVTSEVHNSPFGCDNEYNELKKQYNEFNEQNSEYFIQVQAYKNSLKTLEKQKRVLQRNQLTLEDKIRVLSIELENTSNLLKHSKRINDDFETAKKDLQTKLDNHLVQTKKWRNSSKNLFRLIDSSMSIRTKVGLGFTNYISENVLGWDDSEFSVFTTTSEDVEARPFFHRFAKNDSMKAVPPPLTGDYTCLSDHTDLDESQMSYGTKSSTSCDPKYVSNDFVSCDDSDKSLEVNTNDFAFSDSSVKSLEHKPTDSTCCALTTSVSTSVNEAEIASNVGTPIKEPIIVQDLPSFTCNSSNKNEHTSRTSCNKNGYFNKKAGHFRKNASSVSKTGKVHIPPVRPQSVPTGKPKVKPVPNGKPKVTPVPTGKPKVTPIPTSKPKVTPVPIGKPKVTPVPTGKSHVSTPVPTGRPNRPFPVPTDRGYSPSVISGWWSQIYGQLLLSPQQVVLGNHIEKENPFLTTADEGIFDSGCSRSMTGNKERLDDFQVFQSGKVTFGGGEGRITGKGTVRTPTLDFENVYYVKELPQFNLFSISQICDKKNQVLFTDTECLVLSKDFKLPDESMVVLRVPRKHNLYSINLNNLYPRGNLACLLAHASFDESVKWHRRMAHVNYKNMNRLVKGNLVRGLPPKLFKNGHTCVACCKVRTACYVLNRVSVLVLIMTPYALLTRNIPFVSHFKPFGYHVTILNTSDHLGKFDGKSDKGYIVGYSASNKAYMVYNVPNKRVEESMNLRFLEENPNVQGLGHEWYFDLDYLTDSLGYKHVSANQSTGTQGATTNSVDTSGDKVDDTPFQSADEIFQKELARLKDQEQRVTFDAESLDLGFANNAEELQTQTSAKTFPPGCIPVPTGKVPVPTGSIPVPFATTKVSTDDVPVHTSSLTDLIFDDEPTTRFACLSDLGNHGPSPGIFSSSSYDDEFGTALNIVASNVEVSPVETTRIHTIHPQSLIIGDPTSAMQMRSKALEDLSWVDAIQEEMQQFKFQNVWILVDFPAAQGHRQEEGIDYDEVFDLVARIEAIRLFLAFASYMGFLVYHMDVKSAFLYGRIDEEAWCDEFEALMKGEFQMSAVGELTFFLESSFVLEAYSDSNYARANKDRKSTTGGCQFLGRRLISWQCKKQTIMATSSTEAEYVAAANCCGQFWSTATLRAPELGPSSILATIDKTPYTITEDLVRSRLQLADDGGIADLPIAEIYSRLDHLGHVTEGKLTFFKNKFLPQWRFLVHTLLHYLSTKSGSWDQFGSPIAIVLIYLSNGRRFNWSNYIFKGMVSNIGNAKKFLMYPRFIQIILGIETRVTRQYKVLVFSSKLFANMRLNFVGHPMPLLPAMLLQAQAGKGAEVAEQAVPHPMPAPDQSPTHLPTPSRPQTSDPVAPILKHGHSSDLHTTSVSHSHETDAGPFTTVDDAPMRGDFHTSPQRSSHAPSACQPSGGEEDPIILTALSSVISNLVKKVKLKTKKRKLVVTVTVDSDIPSGSTSQIPAASLSVPNAGPPCTSGVPTGTFGVPPGTFGVPTGTSDVPPGVSDVLTGALTVPVGSPTVPTDVLSLADPTGILSKGKSPMVEEDIPINARTFKQMEEDRLVEETAKQLHDEEMAQMERERAEEEALGQKHMHKPKSTLPKLDLDAHAQTLIKVVVNENSDDEDSNDEVWYAIVGWEILHMVDRRDLVKLYGLVVQYYENHPVAGAGAGLLFWGDLQFAQNYRVFNSPMLHLLRVEMVINSPWIMPILGTKELASPEQTAP